MSIAVAVRKGHHIVLATDTQTTSHGNETQPEDNYFARKVVAANGAQIACCGSMVLLNAIESDLFPRVELSSEQNVFECFVGLWKRLCDDIRIAIPTDDDGDPIVNIGTEFLVVSNKIYEVDASFRVRALSQYCAIGSGAAYAYGSLITAYSRLTNASEIAEAAVRAAISFDAKCGGSIITHDATIPAE